MIRSRPWQFVWFFCLLIMLQSLWLNRRLNLAFKISPEVMQAEAQRKQAKELAKIPQVEIEETLAKGGRLWFEPKSEEFDGQFEIEVWASASEPVKKVDLRFFYSPKDLQLINLWKWQVDESVGLISFSQEFEEAKEDEFLLGALQFLPKNEEETQLEFDFSKESLTDCNLINEDGEDILEEVGEGRYQIISNYSN